MSKFEQTGGETGPELPFEEEKDGSVVIDVNEGARIIKKAEESRQLKDAEARRREELKQYGPAIAKDRARSRGEMHIAKPPAAERQQLADEVLSALGENIEFEPKDERDDRESGEKAA